MTKLLIAVRRSEEVPEADFAGCLRGGFSSLPGLRWWTVEVAQPGQHLLVAAGLRFDGRAIYDALLWCWFDELGPAIEDALITFDAGCDVQAVLRLEERLGWDRSETDGEALGPEAVKMVSFVVRRPEVDRENFERDYADHVAVARVHHPGVWRYVQNLVTAGTGQGSDGVEAVSELWYASADDFLSRFYATDESPGVVKADNEEYIDFARTRSLVLVAPPNGVA